MIMSGPLGTKFVFDALMREIWLRSNNRLLAMGLILPSLGFLLGAALVVVAVNYPSLQWLTLVGGLVMAASLAAGGVIANTLRMPRLAYEHEHLLVYLGDVTPFRIPVEIVECFFLGHGPAMLAGAEEHGAETRTIIVRLAEAAEAWKSREVKPALGHWCNGYVTIRGTWCEPITPDLVQGMNQRLIEIHRQQRAEKQSPRKETS